MTNEKYRDWLREIRKSKKLNAKATAELIGLGVSTYRQIEYGVRNPSVDTAKKIADFLDFDWRKFFSDEEMKSLAAAKRRQLKYRDWLRTIRKSKGLRAIDVANGSDIVVSTYFAIEHNRLNPSIATAKKIANYLDFDWKRFFPDKDEETLMAAERKCFNYRHWLRAVRENKGLRELDVAIGVGISVLTYACIERNTVNPSVKTAKKIANYLDCDWVKFFEDI